VENVDYVNRSRYAMQIKRYLRLFPSERLLFLVFEEFVLHPAETLSEIATFLGVCPSGFLNIDRGARNASPTDNQLLRFPAALRPNFTQFDRRNLWRLLRDDVRELEQLLGRRLGIWRKYED